MMRIIITLVVCIFWAIGCRPELEKVMNEEEITIIANAVEEKVSGYSDAIKRLDVDAMLDFWANTDSLVLASDGSLIVGYDKWAPMLREIISKTTEVSNIEFKNLNTYVLSKESASISLEFEWRMINEVGDTVKSKGSWIYVFKQFNGNWKAIHSAGTHLYY
jgi:ketosteroid isomerase-like protein